MRHACPDFRALARSLAPVGVAAGFFALTIQPGMAQSPGPDTLHRQMSNQLGVLEYCISKGSPSEAAATTYETFIASLPAPADPEASALFREKGKEGIIYNGADSQIPVEQMAEGTSQTLAEYCKSYDENAKALAAAR